MGSGCVGEPMLEAQDGVYNSRQGDFYEIQIFPHLVGLEVETVAVPHKVSEGLQFTQCPVQLLVENWRPDTGNLCDHLVENILMHCWSNGDCIIDITRKTEENILYAIVNVVYPEGNGCNCTPLASFEFIPVFICESQNFSQFNLCPLDLRRETRESRLPKDSHATSPPA